MVDLVLRGEGFVQEGQTIEWVTGNFLAEAQSVDPNVVYIEYSVQTQTPANPAPGIAATPGSDYTQLDETFFNSGYLELEVNRDSRDEDYESFEVHSTMTFEYLNGTRFTLLIIHELIISGQSGPSNDVPSGFIPSSMTWTDADPAADHDYQSSSISYDPSEDVWVSDGASPNPTDLGDDISDSWGFGDSFRDIAEQQVTAFWHTLGIERANEYGEARGYDGLGDLIDRKVDLKDDLVTFGTNNLGDMNDAFNSSSPNAFEELQDRIFQNASDFAKSLQDNVNKFEAWLIEGWRLEFLRDNDSQQLNQAIDNTKSLFFDPGSVTLGINGSNDWMEGGDYSDGFIGGSFDDVIFGHGGNDRALGMGGDDYIVGGSGDDDLSGGSGDDELYGDDDDDLLYGNDGNDDLFGEMGSDDLVGGKGKDFLDGGEGVDVLIGGKGTDYYWGGADTDYFVFESINESKKGKARDTIGDFDKALDYIDLASIDAKKGGFDDAFTWIGTDKLKNKGDLHYKDKGGYFIVAGNVKGNKKADFEIKVEGPDLFELREIDFIL